jgi:hypothetical protein
MQLSLHRFVEIEDDLDRTSWLAAFFDVPGTPPPLGVRYPLLRAGESPYTWLCDQFRRAQARAGMRARIRRSVVEILVTEANREPVRDRAQVLGQMLEVAGTCGFTAITGTLHGWVKADAYRDSSYQLGTNAIPLRRTIWAILISWRKTHGLRKALTRDFARPRLGSQQLCFAELGRLAPPEAIRRIPKILDWPEPYWREALYDFLSRLGAREALSSDHEKAWTECLGEILFYQYKSDLLMGTPAPLQEVLQEVGLCFDRRSRDIIPKQERRTPAVLGSRRAVRTSEASRPAGSFFVVGEPTRRIRIKSRSVKDLWDRTLSEHINGALARPS